MYPLLKIFFVGLFVSFLGSLPLGTLNIAAMQLSISDGVMAAIFFSLGSLLVEIIYVRTSLVAITWIQKNKKLFRILEYVTLSIVLILAASSFYAAMNPTEEKNFVLSSSLPPFLLGAAICAVSPGQIPFWLGWSTILFSKKILLPKNSHYNLYIIGIGIGTFIGNCFFIFGGLLISKSVKKNQHIMQWIIGGIFLATAIIQVWKMIKDRNKEDKYESDDDKIKRIN